MKVATSEYISYRESITIFYNISIESLQCAMLILKYDTLYMHDTHVEKGKFSR